MKERKSQFNIVSGDRTTHGGYHTGTLNLNHLSALLINGEKVSIEPGLIHAKSRVERGIRFQEDQELVKDGKLYWIIWVTVDRNATGSFYAGITACSMMIDHELRKGWKNLAEHVNRMDDALKRRVNIDELPAAAKQALRDFLEAHNKETWANSSDELKQQLL
ncbi:YwhD family protein [Seinonella peptonophila]|uniref:YwhD family protein n=1 Tax=Seinonella peptonophila TaxID=112248 RepID=A0A1M4WWQ9_9BACL|nr:YwhD family protein [Seinonella peptonophila]SHE85635.1 YwhD family protein [Seinonella peptonophila]